MQRGFTSLLAGVIDYAGLFPPAKLTLEEAVETYLELRRGSHNWLVSRFSVGAAHLAELGAELEKHELDEVLPLAVIGSGAHENHHWKVDLDHDLAAIKKFSEKHGDRGYIEALEVKVPHNKMVDEAIRLIAPVEIQDLFIELPWEAGMEDAVASLAGSESVFAKARTGGAEAAAFPSAEQLAFFIQHCVQLDLPFKLTAGLHHPFPTKDASGAVAHGFLNVLAGVALTYQEDLTVAELKRVLEETRKEAIGFSEDGITWNGIDLSVELIEEARELFLSFGSCSIAEPVKDLEGLGLVLS